MGRQALILVLPRPAALCLDVEAIGQLEVDEAEHRLHRRILDILVVQALALLIDAQSDDAELAGLSVIIIAAEGPVEEAVAKGFEPQFRAPPAHRPADPLGAATRSEERRA